MNNWWQNLNLTAQERKFVIGVVLAFAIVLNFLFIWPQFGRWKPLEGELKEKRDLLAEYETKITELPKLQAQLGKLETNSTAPLMVSGDAKSHFSRTVENLARQNRFIYGDLGTPSVNLNSTNKYFQELSMRVTFNGTEEKDLVNFLFKLSEGNSSIRVRDFSITPNQPPMLLQGWLILVANYEVEKTAARSTGAKTATLTAKTP